MVWAIIDWSASGSLGGGGGEFHQTDHKVRPPKGLNNMCGRNSATILHNRNEWMVLPLFQATLQALRGVKAAPSWMPFLRNAALCKQAQKIIHEDEDQCRYCCLPPSPHPFPYFPLFSFSLALHGLILAWVLPFHPGCYRARGIIKAAFSVGGLSESS